jgi:hypothetical protein
MFDLGNRYAFLDIGLEHCLRLLPKVLTMFEGLHKDPMELSTYEKAMIAAASVLHDLGLCYQAIFPAPEQSWELIWRERGQNGENLLELALGTDRSACPSLEIKPDMSAPLRHAAEIAFAACGGRCWRRLMENGYEDAVAFDNNRYRPQLLAALLRLADELDMVQERGLSCSALNEIEMPQHEKLYWYSSHFVRGTQIRNPSSGGLEFLVMWEPPGEADGCDVDTIEKLLQVYRVERILSVRDQCNPFLRVSADDPPAVIAEPKLCALRRFGDQELVVLEDLLDFIEVHPVPEIPDEIREIPGLRQVKTIARKYIKTGETGIIHQHVRLCTPFHTDKLIQCRSLVSGSGGGEFVRRLANELCDLPFIIEGAYTHLLALGTTAIRVTSMLSHGLRIPMTYTLEASPFYMRYEWDYVLPANARVLVVDDILGRGTVASKKLRELIDRCSPQHIDFLVVYLVGLKPEIDKSLLETVRFRYLVHYPDVKYYPVIAGNRCRKCHDWSVDPPHESTFLFREPFHSLEQVSNEELRRRHETTS